MRLKVDGKTLREPVAMLADTRYLLAAIIAPQGQALYHWQETGVDPDAKINALVAFREQLAGVLQPLLTGCRFDVTRAERVPCRACAAPIAICGRSQSRRRWPI